MKKSEFSELSLAELNEKLREDLESLQNYRFQLSMQQLVYISVIQKVKKVNKLRSKAIQNCFKAGVKLGLGSDLHGREYLKKQSNELVLRSYYQKNILYK